MIQNIWKLPELTLIAFLIIGGHSHGVNALTPTKCTSIDSWADLKSEIEDSRQAIVPLCPFKVTHEGNEFEGLYIFKERHVVCIKNDENDKCLVEGSGRHFNIFGDGTTLMGIDFTGSRHGAIQIKASGVSVIDCTFETNDRSQSESRNADGGAIEILNGSNAVLISDSRFLGNAAKRGGGISGIDASVFLRYTSFDNNIATDGGGAVAVGTINVENSKFNENLAEKEGPVIFSTGVQVEGMIFENTPWNETEMDSSKIQQVVEILNTMPSPEVGMCNYYALTSSCSRSSMDTCDGISSSEGCEKFSNVCAYPSASPSALPSKYPSTSPTVQPSSTPTTFPSKLPSSSPSGKPSKTPSSEPSSKPTVIPTNSPTLTPSASPSSKPSIVPTIAPSKKPSQLPSGKPSAEPSDVPSMQPSISIMPSGEPSSTPTNIPSNVPSTSPSTIPTSAPTSLPSLSPSRTPTYTPSAIPSISSAPTMTCNMTPKDRSEQITSLYSHKFNYSTSLANNNVALQWLLQEDNVYVCPDDLGLDQRYGAASLSIELGLVSKYNMSHWEECDWNGIQCNSNFAISTIGGADMSGTIPREVSLLSSLTTIHMKKGKLSGTIPSSLWTLPKLERIDLDQNSLTGSLPSFNHTQNMTSLKRLDVNFNQLTGSIDPLLFMPNIQVAMLDNNALSGTIPSGIGSLTQLRALTLHGNNLHGTMPESVCQLRKFNGGNLDYLMADCDGKVPKVNCSCCSHCNPY